MQSYKENPDTYIFILEQFFAIQTLYIRDLSDRWK